MGTGVTSFIGWLNSWLNSWGGSGSGAGYVAGTAPVSLGASGTVEAVGWIGGTASITIDVTWIADEVPQQAESGGAHWIYRAPQQPQQFVKPIKEPIQPIEPPPVKPKVYNGVAAASVAPVETTAKATPYTRPPEIDALLSRLTVEQIETVDVGSTILTTSIAAIDAQEQADKAIEKAMLRRQDDDLALLMILAELV